MTIQNIVVAVDGSEPSRNAVIWTAHFAEAIGARVTAVYVVSPICSPGIVAAAIAPISQALFEVLLQENRRVLADDWCAPLRDAAVPFTPVVADGAPSVVILEEAQRCGADLLVAGTRGHGGFSELLLGSVTRHLVHHAPLPVVVVRGQGAALSVPRKIMVGLDGSDDSDVALEWAMTVAVRLGAHLVLASILSGSPGSTAEEDVNTGKGLEVKASAIRAAGVPCEAVLSTSITAAGELIKLATSYRADLIVVGHRGTSLVNEWALGSVGSELTDHASQPVVVVRRPPEALGVAAAGPGYHYVSE